MRPPRSCQCVEQARLHHLRHVEERLVRLRDKREMWKNIRVMNDARKCLTLRSVERIFVW